MALLGRVIEVYKGRLDDMAQAISEEMGAPVATVARPLQAPSGPGHFKVALGVLKRDLPWTMIAIACCAAPPSERPPVR